MFHADDVSTSDAVICPSVIKVSIAVYRRYLHSIRMNLKEFLRIPLDSHVSSASVLAFQSLFVSQSPCCECLFYCCICKVAFACGRERTIQCHMQTVCVFMVFKVMSYCLERSHRMTAGRAFTYLIYVFYRFHLYKSFYCNSVFAE